jgi:hypothetical protein
MAMLQFMRRHKLAWRVNDWTRTILRRGGPSTCMVLNDEPLNAIVRWYNISSSPMDAMILHEYPIFLYNRCRASESPEFKDANTKSHVGHCPKAGPVTSHPHNPFLQVHRNSTSILYSCFWSLKWALSEKFTHLIMCTLLRFTVPTNLLVKNW